MVLHNELQITQNLNTPDFNLERDILGGSVVETEELLGGAILNKNNNKFRINIITIIISAIIFICILIWFDFIQTAFFIWLDPTVESSLLPVKIKLFYALFSTLFILAIIVLIYYHNHDILN